jgi:hypothetical protein
VSPRQALELGLKVDMEAVPKNVATAIKAGKVDLNDPANTLLLLKANAVVGVTGFFNQDGGRRVIGRPQLPGESQISPQSVPCQGADDLAGCWARPSP